MAQGGADAVLDEFDRLSDFDRDTLVQELSETGMPGQQFSVWHGTKGPEAGTPFLLYYGPAWCQRVGQQQPRLALRMLAEIFRLGRNEFPESQDRLRDEKEGILCRTVEVGLLKTTSIEKWEGYSQCESSEALFGGMVLDRSSHLEGTL
eukprot:344740-Amphidinium_carterae.1